MHTAGQTLEFEVLLWSKSAEALKLLAQPAAVSVGYYKANFLPSSEALRPRDQSRKTRTLERMAEGRVWAADSGRPSDDAPVPVLVSLDSVATTAPSPKPRPAGGSRMQSWTAEDEDNATAEAPTDGEAGTERPPSPVASIEDDLDDTAESEHFHRLVGDVRIPACRPVSYRYTEIGREVSICVVSCLYLG